MKKIPRLEKWYVVNLTDTVIVGQIFDHKKHHNGFHFQTDNVLLIKDGYVVTDKNIYKLGEPDKVWYKNYVQ